MIRFKSDVSEKEIAKRVGMAVLELRAKNAKDKEDLRKELYKKAKELKGKGLSNAEIGEIMQINESSIKHLLG